MKRKLSALAISLIGLSVFCWLVLGGDLEPPGPPGPTMYTLEEIHTILEQLLEQQQAQMNSPANGFEVRAKGCLSLDSPGLQRDPADAHDLSCSEAEPPGTRLLDVQLISEGHSPDGWLYSIEIKKHVDINSPALHELMGAGRVFVAGRISLFGYGQGGPDPLAYPLEFTLKEIRGIATEVVPTTTGFAHIETIVMEMGLVSGTWPRNSDEPMEIEPETGSGALRSGTASSMRTLDEMHELAAAAQAALQSLDSPLNVHADPRGEMLVHLDNCQGGVETNPYQGWTRARKLEFSAGSNSMGELVLGMPVQLNWDCLRREHELGRMFNSIEVVFLDSALHGSEYYRIELVGELFLAGLQTEIIPRADGGFAHVLTVVLQSVSTVRWRIAGGACVQWRESSGWEPC